ncbi:MAG: RluA family pseudouridine synthase [Verrucomicrobiae bacterium]|nr:RluA family pseudouridine synthase [Verrucomicrobiae bacterium]
MPPTPLPPILYEDDFLLAFDKPGGLLTAPGNMEKEGVNLMQLVHEQKGANIFNVHRLDRGTSGVLLCAKDKTSLDFLCGLFQSRKIEKRYLAICHGAPPRQEDCIDLPIGEDFRRPGFMRVAKGGRPSQTRYRVLEQFRGHVWLEVFPLTGRTHQIRVHLKAIGCTIMVDPLYGDGRPFYLSAIKPAYKLKRGAIERPLIKRLALHAERLALIHPQTREPLVIQAPAPKDFEITLKYLRRFLPRGGQSENAGNPSHADVLVP